MSTPLDQPTWSSLQPQWHSRDVSWASLLYLAVTLYGWFWGMLQEHLIQGDFHHVVRHRYLPCFWKSLTVTCRKLNELLLCFRCTLPSASAASCCQRQIAMQVLWPALVPSFFYTVTVNDLRVLSDVWVCHFFFFKANSQLEHCHWIQGDWQSTES